MRRTSQSAPEYSLSLKKLPPLTKILTAPKLGPKKTVSIITFRIAWTHDVKIVLYGIHATICVSREIWCLRYAIYFLYTTSKS